MALTADDLDFLRTCLDSALRNPELTSEYFHEELFRRAPDARTLYRMELRRQGPMLMNRLGVILSRMHDVEALRPFVSDLARRHVAYGVKADHYPIVREALVVAFRRVLGTEFTPKAEAILNEAYDSVAEIMIDVSYHNQTSH